MARLPIQQSTGQAPRAINQQFATANAFSGGAQGLADVGEALSKYAEIEKTILNDAEVSNAVAMAGGVLATVRTEAKGVPIGEIDGFYTDQTEKAYGELTANMNPAVKREFDKNWARLNIATRAEVNMDRRGRLTSETKANVDQHLLNAQKAIAAAGYGSETAYWIEEGGVGRILRLQEVGVYDAEEAQAKIEDFKSENAAIGVRQLMMDDPVAARDALEDDQQFSALDPETRIQMLERAQAKVDTLERSNIAQDEKLQAEYRRQLKEAQEARASELTADIIEDPLSYSIADIEEEQRSGRINPADAQTLYKFLTSEQQEARLDPYTYTGLIDDAYDLADISDPATLRREMAALRQRAANAYADNIIERADYNAIKSLVDAVGSDTFTGVKSGRDFVKSAFGVTEGAFIPRDAGDTTSLEMQNALREYDVRVNAAMAKGEPFNPLNIATDIVARTSKSSANVEAMLPPRFGLKDKAGDYLKPSQYTVGDALRVLENTVAQFHENKISRAEFLEEKNKLEMIRRYASRKSTIQSAPAGSELAPPIGMD